MRRLWFSLLIAIVPASYTTSVSATSNCERLVTYALGSVPAHSLRGRPGESPAQFSQRRYRGVDQLMFKNAQGKFVDQSFIARLNRIHPGFDVLIFDEGLIFRIDEFEAWWAGEDRKDLTPWQVRQAFSDHLGTRTVYRALQLSETELEEIVKFGLFPKNLPATTAAASFHQNDMDIVAEVLHHLIRTTAKPLVQSVSSLAEVALAAVKGATLGSSVVLFALELPRIDLLYLSANHKILNVSRTHDFKEMFANDLYITQPHSTAPTAYIYDQFVESFIFKPILAAQIKSWKRIDWAQCPDLKWIKHRRLT